MKIQLSKNFMLDSDSNGWSCYKRFVVETGKSTGQEVWKAVFHSCSLAGILELLPDYTLRMSHAETVEEAVAELRALGAEVRASLAGVFGEADMRALSAPRPVLSKAQQALLDEASRVLWEKPTPGSSGDPEAPGAALAGSSEEGA